MRTLVLGGIRSGKSGWAEDAVTRAAGATPVRYIATGRGGQDADFAARIAAHRGRRPQHWQTVETVEVAAALRDAAVPTLVDDVGNWLVAAMDRADGWSGGEVRDEVDELAAAVTAFAAPLVLVSPEVGLTVVPATASGRQFADQLGWCNQRLAAVCDEVVLVVAGIPVPVKTGGSA